VEFTSPLDEYVVLKLALPQYKATTRSLASGYQLGGFTVRDQVRQQEKQLLTRYFQNWAGPYEGSLEGWREDSPTYVLYGDALVAGVYLCAENEFNEGEDWGQVHYAFIDPEHGGRGVYSVLFQAVVEKARTWGLRGLILNSDRHLLPEVYIRWGAIPWKTIGKKPVPRRASLPRRILRRFFSG
jgi:GNAT superfamily N-acetyltransferase